MRLPALLGLFLPAALAVAGAEVPAELKPWFAPPPEFAGRLGSGEAAAIFDEIARGVIVTVGL